MKKLTPREVADLRKRTCSRCARGHHDLCTTPKTCAHYLCDDESPVPAPTSDPDPQPNPIERSPSAGATGGRRPSPTSTPTDPRDPTIDFEWEDPPPRKNGRRPLDEILAATGTLDELRKNPNRWARIVRYGSNTGATAAAGKLRKALGSEFEWTSKRVPRLAGQPTQAGSILYGRHVGKTS